MFCQFLLYSNMNQLFIYIYPLFGGIFFHHIYALIYNICLSLSALFHSVSAIL